MTDQLTWKCCTVALSWYIAERIATYVVHGKHNLTDSRGGVWMDGYNKVYSYATLEEMEKVVSAFQYTQQIAM